MVIVPYKSTLEHFVNHIYRGAKGVNILVCHTALSTIKDVDRGIDYECEKTICVW